MIYSLTGSGCATMVDCITGNGCLTGAGCNCEVLTKREVKYFFYFFIPTKRGGKNQGKGYHYRVKMADLKIGILTNPELNVSKG